MSHRLRLLGPAEVQGPVEREHLRVSLMRFSLVFWSSNCLLSLIYPLKIFFMTFHMEDMNACLS